MFRSLALGLPLGLARGLLAALVGAAPAAAQSPAFDSPTPVTTGVPGVTLARAIDGDVDLVAAPPLDGLLLTRARGISGYDVPAAIAPSIAGAMELAAADLDGDGDADLLSGGPVCGALGIHEQIAPGVFAPRRTIATDTRAVAEIEVGDLDADGVLDVVTRRVGTATTRITWQRGLGAGQFAASEEISIDSGVRDVVTADVDTDPGDEVLWITGATRTVVAVASSSATSMGTSVPT